MTLILNPIQPGGGGGGASSIKIGNNTYATDGNGLVTIPAQVLAAFSGFNPLDLPDLLRQVQAIQIPSNGLVTLAQLRTLENPVAAFTYRMTDEGREGDWYYDAVDTSSTDDTGTCIVTTNGKRIKRRYRGGVRLSWYLGTQESVDISLLIRNINIRMGLANKIVPIYIDANTQYRWENYIIFNPYPLDLRCVEGQADISVISDRMMWLTRGNYLEGLRCGGNSGPAPTASGGGASTNDDDYAMLSLVQNSGVSTIKRCEFMNSRGDGLYCDGNIGIRNELFPTGSNSSRSQILECSFRQNKGSGFVSRGFDANIITVTKYNSTDNGRFGIDGDDFLGSFFRDEGHTNNNGLGGHRIQNPNNRGKLDSAYEEDGQPPSFFEGRLTLVANRLTTSNGRPHVGAFVSLGAQPEI